MSGEEATEETTEETTEVPSMVPETEPSKEEYMCSVCESIVVPEEIETERGIRYRCPKCNKFMKPLTPKQVKEIREEERGPLPPLEVMLTDRVKELLAENLPRVHGIPQKEATKTMAAILDTLNPEAASNPWNLHNHVKNFAPNADDRHLESIIKKVFGQLEVEGYVKTGRGHQPSYGRTTEEGYRPSYARRERRSDDYEEDYEEDYGDYPPKGRRSTRMKVVVDGQEIETDYRGYLAHQAWKREQAEEKRGAEEHELRMKRLEAEILKITGETGGSKTPQGPHEEVREFLDAEGNLCDPEKAVSVRIKKTPIQSQRSKGEEAEERRREEEHELRMKRLEAEILKITGETGGSKQGSFEEVREFIDAEGKLCDPEKAVSVRIKRAPIATKELTPEEVRRIIREEKEQLTPEKVREIMRTESGKGESEEVKALQQQLGEQRKTMEDLKGTIESKDRQVLLDKIGDLEGRVKDLATTGVGDWKSDEIRLIKGSIGDIKDLLQTYLSGERPLDRAERILTGGPQAAGAKPPSEMAGEAERAGVIQELRKHGLVTRILER